MPVPVIVSFILPKGVSHRIQDVHASHTHGPIVPQGLYFFSTFKNLALRPTKVPCYDRYSSLPADKRSTSLSSSEQPKYVRSNSQNWSSG